MIRIDSVSNKTIKRISALKMKKNRDGEGLFFAEGARNVLDGIKKQTPEAIFICDGYEGKTDFPCEVFSVSKPVFEKLSDTKTPQGILGVFKKRTVSASDISSGGVLILNGVSDPGNAGTLLRSALAFGFVNIIADKKTVDLFSPKVVRSAMSAVFALNIAVCGELFSAISDLKKKGYTVYCADMDGEEPSTISFSEKTAVIVGNEANGVDDGVLKCADRVAGIPMSAECESLNAAVAGSILMYEVKRINK